ncbi:MAG: polyprenyl synthetase family protein [Deltaproteobacteria bacterium]|nr:polyprenyl synthetase family protein [Deltaproteobacteria bacterium]
MYKDKYLTVAKDVDEFLENFLKNLTQTENSRLFFPIKEMDILNEVKDLTLRGGKRLRPALIVGGYELFKENALSSQNIINACGAIELMQSYFLIHDDIMDEDDLRRGAKSVHKSLGDKTGSLKKGIDLGILAGDLSCALSNMLMSRVSDEENCSGAAFAKEIFFRMPIDVIGGQNMDMLNDDPYETVLRKTASYTTVAPLCIGGALAGATPDVIEILKAVGVNLGVAFQYRDDMASLFEDPKKTGKPFGSDLLNCKNTYIIRTALLTADDSQKSALKSVLGNHEASENMIHQALNAIVECGAKQECENVIDDLAKQSVTFLKDGAGNIFRSAGVDFLEWMILKLTKRSF